MGLFYLLPGFPCRLGVGSRLHLAVDSAPGSGSGSSLVWTEGVQVAEVRMAHSAQIKEADLPPFACSSQGTSTLQSDLHTGALVRRAG